MESYLVITNEGAGTADQESLDRAVAVLSERASVEVAATSNPGELDGVLHRAGSRRIVVAGGDGSLHAVVTALHRRHDLADSVLGLIPLGTGNDFARGVGLPLDPAAAARLVTSGRARPVDLLRDDAGGIVVNNVHLGAGAEAGKAAGPWKRALGPIGYAVGALIAGLRPATLHVRVTVDGVLVSDRPVLQVAIGNAPYVGGGTELTPTARPTDGKVDVLISYSLSPAARAAYALRLRKGEHHKRDDVVTHRATEVTVEGEEFHVSADGEIEGPFQRRTWRVDQAALTMVLP